MNEKFEEAEKVHKEISALNEIFKDVVVSANQQGVVLRQVDRIVENAPINNRHYSRKQAKKRASGFCCSCLMWILESILLSAFVTLLANIGIYLYNLMH